ncbi:uncharacterized protein LOC131637023 [Vicia villosa]|uniref:uncharacterized protein LOC131637023 n=1 Tax=Vicia villosa TaxID=3911 RepID=UPI00273C7618|nr:uncharacterized protein LOC131637023 [Vicia villosa]
MYIIWEAKNNERFNNVKLNVSKSRQRVQNQIYITAHNSTVNSRVSIADFKILNAFNIAIKPPKVRKILEVIWYPPTIGWIKCNCDGSYNHNGLPATCRSLFRDCRDNFLLAFADSVPWMSSYLAKLVVVIRAMEISIEKSWGRLWIETE